MEKRSESDSSEIMGDWDFTPPVDPEGITMISVPTSQESKDARSNPLETRVSTSIVAGEGKEEAARRVLPPWMEPSYEWGSGKWREDGRKKKKRRIKRKRVKR
ncbi:hypothetical protein V5N11_007339 [Cardamine amara subsp. amara]|uniref:Uncharacterized protein n=1 Tax=Cardamine amara subsp. amara TaxID=228776 RepID=A0ABD1BI87_CARAN